MKISLLGGSNSIYGCGISTGIGSIRGITLKNFALGASSSLQNLHELLRNRCEITESDIIYCESNVNDSFNVAHLILDMATAKRNILALYQELASIKKPVCVFLMPINKDRIGTIETNAQIEELYQFHLDMIEKYHFFYIDILAGLSKVGQEKLNILMPDCRHAKPLLMHDITKNLTSFFFRNLSKFSPVEQKDELKHAFYTIDSSDISKDRNLPIHLMKNTYFSEKVITINNSKIQISPPSSNTLLVGIGTWCEANSHNLKITIDKEKEIIKSFNQLNSFNEIIDEAEVSKSIELSITHEDETERTILHETKTSRCCGVNIYALLFCSMEACNMFSFHIYSGVKNLSRFIPNLNHYIFDANYSSKQAIQNNEKVTSLSDIVKLFNLLGKVSNVCPSESFEMAKILYRYLPKTEENILRMNRLKSNLNCKPLLK